MPPLPSLYEAFCQLYGQRVAKSYQPLITRRKATLQLMVEPTSPEFILCDDNNGSSCSLVRHYLKYLKHCSLPRGHFHESGVTTSVSSAHKDPSSPPKPHSKMSPSDPREKGIAGVCIFSQPGPCPTALRKGL